MLYASDFETIKNDDGSMRVWLADVCTIDTELKHETFTSISDLFDWAFDQRQQTTLYFHNLKFDGSYIINYANSLGYIFAEKSKDPCTYWMLVTDKSQWFMGQITNEKGKTVYIRDSLKKVPMSVSAMAKTYKLPILKGEIDYDMPRPLCYQPTNEEIAYIRNDTEIVARTLKIHFDAGMNALTAPADALEEYKRTINFDSIFVPRYWASHRAQEKFCRKAYNGGISWVNPQVKEQIVYNGEVYDYNSMYPSVMLKYPYPCGYPVYFMHEPPEKFDLWIARAKVDIQRKTGHLASIRDPEANIWIENEYIGELFLTSADAEILQMNYYGSCEIIEGYAWRGLKGVFDEFIGHWAEVKKTSKGAKRALAKLMLNSLYGKFGTNPDRAHKVPVFVEGILKWRQAEAEADKGKCFNVAVAAFITAYARLELSIGAANCTNLAYVDTDSLHIFSTENEPAKFNGSIHETEFGHWKKESEFVRAKFLRQKTYIEEGKDGKLNIAACGCPETSKQYITFDNFKMKASYPGKLRPLMRIGGAELVETNFTVRAPFARGF